MLIFLTFVGNFGIIIADKSGLFFEKRIWSIESLNVFIERIKMDINVFVRRAELFMPGVAKHLKVLKKSDFHLYEHWTSVPTDMVCGETENYKIVVAKWQFNHSLPAGDTIYEWLKICFVAKKNGKVRHFNTRRHLTESWKDPFMKKSSFNYAQLEVLEKDTIKVSWVDEDGFSHDKLSYRYNLNKQLN